MAAVPSPSLLEAPPPTGTAAAAAAAGPEVPFDRTGVGACAAALASSLADDDDDAAAPVLAGDWLCGAGRSSPPAGAAGAPPEAPGGAEFCFCPPASEAVGGPAAAGDALAAERAATAANDMGRGAAALGEGPSDMIRWGFGWEVLCWYSSGQINSTEFLKPKIDSIQNKMAKDTRGKRLAGTTCAGSVCDKDTG